MLESAIRRAFTDYLRKKHWQVRNIEDRANAGTPDTFAAHKMHGTCWVEFKRWQPGQPMPERLRAAQVRWIRAMVKVGVPVLIVCNDPDVRGAYIVRRAGLDVGPDWLRDWARAAGSSITECYTEFETLDLPF